VERIAVTTLREAARAKINLTLEVRGRRADGFHALESLVAFASVADRLEFEPGPALSLSVEGEFAQLLAGGNLVLRAAEAAKAMVPGLRLGRFRLMKNLPVASGLGGGSADAAATLRLLAKVNPGALTEAALGAIADGLGSDIRVCLESRPGLMLGRGERVLPVASFPPCAVVLVNPGEQLATRDVFAALKAPLLATQPADAALPEFSGDFDMLVAYVAAHANDLEAPAERLVPSIRDVLAALKRQEGARIARLSGSGPTCFALFRTLAEAEHAVRALAGSRRRWPWVVAAGLG
jgi:4-diphosphocytidyl-2-C-methyl-D-erythritol kinase